MKLATLFALSAALVLSVGVATANASTNPAGGNAANAHLCQKDGWMRLQTSTGAPFANEGACVSYAARGGTLVPVTPPSVSISFSPTADPSYCYITVNLSHFAPNTGYTVDGQVTGYYGDTYPFSRGVTTDSSGSASVLVFSFFQLLPNTVEANVGSVDSGVQPISC